MIYDPWRACAVGVLGTGCVAARTGFHRLGHLRSGSAQESIGRGSMKGLLLGSTAGVAGLAAWLTLGGPKLPRDIDEAIDRVSRSDLSDVVSGHTGFADSAGVRIWYEDRPAVGAERGVVLLLTGLAGDSLFWPARVLRALAEAGYRVVRFDARGTGESDWMEDWDRRHPYTLEDMAADVVAVLDERGVSRAHLIGLSLGGFVAQEVAIAAPSRVVSLTLMSTSADPTDMEVGEPRTGHFVRAGLASLPLLRYRLLGGERNLVKELVAKVISVNGYEDLDVEDLARCVLYRQRFRRGLNLRAMLQHQWAVAVTRSRYEALPSVGTPALIVHGEDDPLLPIAHAEKLARLLPHGTLLRLKGVGHVFPYPGMPDVIATVLSHLDMNPE